MESGILKNASVVDGWRVACVRGCTSFTENVAMSHRKVPFG
jgi:hypothetical protein